MVNSIKQIYNSLYDSNVKFQRQQKNRVCISKDLFFTYDLSQVKAAKVNSNLEQVLHKVSDIFDQCRVVDGLEEETVVKIKEELGKLEQRYFSKYNCFTKLIFYSNYSKKEAAFNQVKMSIALFEYRFKDQFTAAKAQKKAQEDEALKA